MYRTAKPPTWDPLPQCKHVKLAMIKEKGKRCGSDKMIAESRVMGDVNKILTIKVPVDSDRIFDASTFNDDCQVILVEGVGGMGKTSLAYQYAQKWAEGKLSTFDAVALVCLRDLNEHDVREVNRTFILPHLLSLATGNSISNELARLLINKRKFLLILDGWDESPASIQKPSFLKNLRWSVSSRTKILITSRPDFSLDLHGLANRVEILGFTKVDIHKYFGNALKSHLSNSEVKSACNKLNGHFHRYPVIESCCYVPLNAAILAYIYLNRDQTLPVTQCELFQELVLCCIFRELETRQPDRVLEDVSSFEDLPGDLQEQLHNLSELAFKGVMQNKIIFTQKELTSLSTLGLLHSVQKFGLLGRKSVTCNFIHLAVQGLFAAYYISRLEPAEHSEHFSTLLKSNLNFLVLQFYAGLTRLTNESVKRLITEFNFGYYSEIPHKQQCLLAFLNCIFEAQLDDEWFFKRMIFILNRLIDLSCVTLTPMDCLSVHYFISSYIKAGAIEQMDLRLSDCNFDDQSLGMLLGIFEPKSASCTLCVLQPIKTLEMTRNKFTDTGVEYIAMTLNLASNSNLEELEIGSDSVTDMGLVSLLEALPRQNSLKRLRLLWSLTDLDKSLEKIGECARRSTSLKQLELFAFSPVFESEEAVKEWAKRMNFEVINLRYSLQYSQVILWMNLKLQCTFSISSQMVHSISEFFCTPFVTSDTSTSILLCI